MTARLRPLMDNAGRMSFPFPASKNFDLIDMLET
jgi:hypothetical protein